MQDRPVFVNVPDLNRQSLKAAVLAMTGAFMFEPVCDLRFHFVPRLHLLKRLFLDSDDVPTLAIHCWRQRLGRRTWLGC